VTLNNCRAELSSGEAYSLPPRRGKGVPQMGHSVGLVRAGVRPVVRHLNRPCPAFCRGVTP